MLPIRIRILQEHQISKVHILRISCTSHLYAPLDNFICGVRFVKPYVTSGREISAPELPPFALSHRPHLHTSGKYFSTAFCIVSLYRSVSSREYTPFGMFGELFGAILQTQAAYVVVYSSGEHKQLRIDIQYPNYLEQERNQQDRK